MRLRPPSPRRSSERVVEIEKSREAFLAVAQIERLDELRAADDADADAEGRTQGQVLAALDRAIAAEAA